MDSPSFPGCTEEQTRAMLAGFSCARCLECCRRPGYVYLQPGEAEAMAGYLGMDIYDFTERFCDVLDRRRLVLKKAGGEDCVFLAEGGCRVHSVKPSQCRGFPVAWRTAASFSYCAGMRRLLPSKIQGPGSNHPVEGL